MPDPSPQPSPAGQEEARDEFVDVELAPPKSKKKRSKKPKSKRGLNAPTGFEEYYVDAPITPAEYEEERSVYDVSRPLIHRMEDAVMRFQQKRRLTNDRRDVFIKYLVYGGINVDQKMFQGTDKRELKEMDKEQILIARNQTSIDDDHAKLPIDFNAVVKGYLTSFFPFYFNPETEATIKLATDTIRNFLSYILYHDVCPEYKDNIDEARRTCDVTATHLWKNQQFTTKGPGAFNTACSTLFGGVHYDNYVPESEWKSGPNEPEHMSCEVARKVVKFALAGAGSRTQASRFQQLANKNDLRAMCVEDIHGFEITAVYPPDAGTREFYKIHAADLCPVARVVGKSYRDPGRPEYDLTPEEQLEWDEGDAVGVELEFFLEETLLGFVYPGMKVITTVWELNCGFHFFDEVRAVYCANYTVLANDMMLGWVKPREKMEDREKDESEDDEESENGEGEKEEKVFL